MRNSKFAVSTAIVICAIAGIGAASAADLPVKARAPVSAVAVYDWTGFYIGGDVGGRWSQSSFLLTGTSNAGGPPPIYPTTGATSVPFGGSAFRYGFYGGYNWQIGSQWVIGAEGDGGWANNTVTQNGFIPGAPLGAPAISQAGENRSFQTKWDASIRLRLGVLVTPAVLLYVSGGPAWQRFNTSAFCNNFQAGGNLTVCGNIGAPSQTITNSATRTGWTIGAGAEAMLWQNWLVRAEYRYSDYGNATLTDTISDPALPAPGTASFTYNIHLKTQTALVGLAYKFGGPIVARY